MSFFTFLFYCLDLSSIDVYRMEEILFNCGPIDIVDAHHCGQIEAVFSRTIHITCAMLLPPGLYIEKMLPPPSSSPVDRILLIQVYLLIVCSHSLFTNVLSLVHATCSRVIPWGFENWCSKFITAYTATDQPTKNTSA